MPNVLTLMIPSAQNGKTAVTSKPDQATSGETAFADFVANADDSATAETKVAPDTETQAGAESDAIEFDEEAEADTQHADIPLAWVPDHQLPAEGSGNAPGRFKRNQSDAALTGEIKTGEPRPGGTPIPQENPAPTAETEQLQATELEQQGTARQSDSGTGRPDAANIHLAANRQAEQPISSKTPPGSESESHLRRPAQVETRYDVDGASDRKAMPQQGLKSGPGAATLIQAQMAQVAGRAATKDISTEDEPVDLLTSHEISSAHTRQEPLSVSSGLTPPSKAEIARAVAGQMAAVITAKPGGGRVEIALNPEELGKVSITLSRRDDGFHMVIAADRPETLDLMRRHISVLSAEFNDMGLGDLTFDLGTPSDMQHDVPPRDHGPFAMTANAEADTETPDIPRRAGPDRALDLRL